MRLLYRFYDPTSGDIYINDQNIRDVNLPSLRTLIGIVPQEPVLFHRDLYYNIQYGRLDASADEIFEKAKMAGIHDAIMTFKDQYQTPVGERGLELSGACTDVCPQTRVRDGRSGGGCP